MIAKKLNKVCDKLSELFDGYNVLIYKKAKYSKDGIIDSERKVQLDNRLDIIVYFLIENGKIKTDNDTLNQTIDYAITMNVVLNDAKIEIENTVSCINAILFQENIFVTDVDFNSDKNLRSDWKADNDKYPYNYSAIGLKAVIENLNLIECNKIDCEK